MKHNYLLLIGLLTVITTGCSTVDTKWPNLQQTFGKVEIRFADDIRKLQDARNEFCITTQDQRKEILKTIVVNLVRVYVPSFPPEGICSPLFNEVVDMIPVWKETRSE